MGWKGAAIGGYLGSVFGGPLGAIIGAVLGFQFEAKLSSKVDREDARTRDRMGKGVGSYATMSERRRKMIFCASAAAMLAKIAKADGRVTRGEIAAVETAFRRLGFSKVARDYAVNVFRRAKDDASHTIYEYAGEFAASVRSTEICELLYELLWDVACADGAVGREERLILSRMPRALGIRPSWYEIFAAERLGTKERFRAEARDALADAYAVLGIDPAADDAAVRRAYREAAKKHHPDALRAQGLPEEMIGKATEQMARINAAWDEIRRSRGL